MLFLKNTRLLYLLVFCFAFIIHVLGLNQIGRTWDEQYKIDHGIHALDSLRQGDISLKSWDRGKDHPMIGKYVYGLSYWPQMTPLKNEKGEAYDISRSTAESITTGNVTFTTINEVTYLAPYDFTLPRLVSAFFNAGAVVLTVIIAGYFLSRTWSLFAGLLLLLIPRYVFLGQLATFESLTTFLFCLVIVVFYKLLNNPKILKWYLFTGLLCGLMIWTRYNNAIILPLLTGWLGIDYLFTKRKGIFTFRLLLIPVLSILVGIVSWPLLWHEFPRFLLESIGFHQERFVGFSLYYSEYLLFTTPLLIILGFILGVFRSVREKGYFQSVLLWLIFATLGFFSFFVITLGGTRYVAFLYPLIAILASFGYSHILRGKFKYGILGIIILLALEMGSVAPYYLDYYNQLVGGIKGAREKGYDFSWWGEGQYEAGMWVNNNAPVGSTLAVLVTPQFVFPRVSPHITFLGSIDKKSSADYIIVSSSEMAKLTDVFLQKYEVVYEAKVANEPLVSVFKKKSLP